MSLLIMAILMTDVVFAYNVVETRGCLQGLDNTHELRTPGGFTNVTARHGDVITGVVFA